jgi:hypothetical protein
MWTSRARASMLKGRAKLCLSQLVGVAFLDVGGGGAGRGGNDRNQRSADGVAEVERRLGQVGELPPELVHLLGLQALRGDGEVQVRHPQRPHRLPLEKRMCM